MYTKGVVMYCVCEVNAKQLQHTIKGLQFLQHPLFCVSLFLVCLLARQHDLPACLVSIDAPDIDITGKDVNTKI